MSTYNYFYAYRNGAAGNDASEWSGKVGDIYLNEDPKWASAIGDELKTISGHVKTTDGRPVDNATTQVTGVDFASLNGTIEEQRDRAREYESLASNPAPSAWRGPEGLNSGQSNTEVSDLLSGSRTGGEYVAVHTPQAWDIPDPTVVTAPIAGDTGYRLRDPELGFESDNGPYGGTAKVPSGQTLILSVWDGDGGNALNTLDPADSDLPGATTEGKIVIEQLGPGGGDNVLDRKTVETDKSIGGSLAAREHKFAEVTLSDGFYRVYPKGSEGSSYIVAVGEPESIVRGWAENLKTQSGALTDQAQALENLRTNGTFDVIRTTTNETGYYAVETSQTVNRTSVIAYKIPSGLDVDPQNATRADIREYYENQDLSDALSTDSVYIATAPNTVDPPADNVNVTVRELSAEPFLGINKTANRTEAIKDYLKDKLNWGGLSDLDQRLIENMPKSELEEYYGTKINLTEDSEQIREEAEDKLVNEDGSGNVDWDTDPSDLNADELKERIQALEDTVKEQQDVIESSSEVGEATNETLNVAFDFARQLTQDDVAVYAVYSNGTQKLVNDTYYTVDSSAIPGSGTEVSVNDYPVDASDPAAVTFRAEVLDNGDTGSETVTARNPSFTGQIPALKSVSLSSLSPGPDETVTVDADGRQNFGKVESVDVTGPDGQTVTTTLDNGEATFTTNGEGRHTVDLTYSNADGQTFTERVDVRAIGADIDQPATIRAERGLGGPYALTGDDLTGGEVNTGNQNSDVTLVGKVGGNDDPPVTIHSHVTTLDTPRRGAVTTRLVRGPSESSVRQRTTVITHFNDLGSDAHIYRVEDGDFQPITQDGNRYGSVSRNNGTTVQTYSTDDGDVTLRYVANPTILEDARWTFETTMERLPDVPFLTVQPAVGV